MTRVYLALFLAAGVAGASGQAKLRPGSALTTGLLLPYAGQQSAASAAPGQTAESVTSLQIVIVDGDAAVNNIKTRVAREPVVEVQDQNRKPVPGAVVTFFLLNQGPGGTFAGDTQLLTVVTGPEGRAVGRSFKPNNAPGQFQIQVSASYAGLIAHAVITQTNILPSGPPGTGAAHPTKISAGKMGLIAGVVGAAAIGAAVALAHGGSSSGGAGSVPTATITLGGGGATVGSPH